MKIKGKKLAPISLGCDKNRVDLEKMLAKLQSAGIEFVTEYKDAQIILINTCAFVGASRQESMENILRAIKEKTSDCEKIIVTGCLNSLHKRDLELLFPKVDAFVDIKDNDNIVEIVSALYDAKVSKKKSLPRLISTPPHYAYLKIADGCENFCSYCTIPFIRGKYKSEKLELIVQEAQWLAENGVKELILVAQDITKYGIDLYGKKSLDKLLKELVKIDGVEWIRLLYCYPEDVDSNLIQLIKKEKKICSYIDIPLQHISNDILEKMNRKTSAEQIIDLVQKLKNNNIAIRSTFITGFPGESKQNFIELKNFIENYKLENVGFFAYSKEKGTRAYYFKNQISNSTKKRRLLSLQNIQNNIMEQHAENMLGKSLRVIIDEKIGENMYIARSEYSAPEVDPYVKIITEKEFEVGNFYMVKITKTDGIDLIAEM